MFTAILSLLGSSAVGSIIGGIFAFLNKKVDIQLKRMELEHELASRDKDIELAKAEAQGRKDVAIIEGETSVETARMETIGVAQKADQITAEDIKAAGKLGWLVVIAAVFNKLIRPATTVILTGTALYLNVIILEHFASSWATLGADKQFDITMQAFAWVTGQASAVVGYWFVARGSGK